MTLTKDEYMIAKVEETCTKAQVNLARLEVRRRLE